ncbi:MAG: rRNA maturation RNase YbeY [Gammaproteobacteria bacterium]|nr:rRNA maturation RNase YbeY [Gammaproteobacteria bacterium]
MINIEVQIAASADEIPSVEMFQVWASAIEADSDEHKDVAMRIVDEAEMGKLNEQYRKKTGVTNVLSFPADLPGGVDIPFLGDIIVCAPVVIKEATDQGKSLHSHWAHMTVHGILHLQGYDHIDHVEAEQMESLETKIMNKLGFENPYV